jgi:Tfp pilus assembly protein PilF
VLDTFLSYRDFRDRSKIELTLVNLGNAYLELDRGQEALAPLKLAVELRPKCLEAHDFLGVAYLKTHDNTSAEEELRLLNNLDSSFAGSLSKLLCTEKRSGS